MYDRLVSRREGSGATSSKRAKRVKLTGQMKRKRTKMPRRKAPTAATWGVVYLDASEFATFEKCMQSPQPPTPSIVEGAELIRRLYKTR